LLIRLTTIEHFLNTNVCHHQKGGDCWNEICLTLTLKSFDDNKVLKKFQLEMLIFIQVYRTIDKKFEIINRFWKNKREQRKKQKGSLKASEESCS